MKEGKPTLWTDGISYPCIGIGERVGDPLRGPLAKLWINPWFLLMAKEGFAIDTPAFRYDVDGVRVTKTRNDNGNVQVFVLTDEYDVEGRRLAVWPD
jgi:hypothetical protein